MNNPIKAFKSRLGMYSKDYQKLVLMTYLRAPEIILRRLKSNLIKGIYYKARGKQQESIRIFLEGSATWGDFVQEMTATKIVKIGNFSEVPESGHIVCINHVNELDFPFDCMIVNKPYLANQVIKNTLFAYWWMKAMGSQVFDYSQSRTIPESVKNLIEGLKNNSYIVYPEGQNTYSEEIKPLKKGMIKIAHEKNIPIALVIKSGIAKFQEKVKGNAIGYKYYGTIQPSKFSKWENLRDELHEIMVQEKNILDEEVRKEEGKKNA
ncbi:MAG: 1-acyl-sn-glycerol-3-phosphate acyltransferase [Leptospiraceae bacterium]|nr:1-acyl-sn-glycerol-3-phosphate acyltransferase [Leptospiraceae bacterium]MCK6381006.1 1-acyl-sn-glycerol-3-phosphate acyltransferase [Leptospiraceae bacterium]NUM42896.1 1-acyl-sn-glycerol-3-phosphate acyltransferase [Leptospiraceae bacterium]